MGRTVAWRVFAGWLLLVGVVVLGLPAGAQAGPINTRESPVRGEGNPVVGGACVSPGPHGFSDVPAGSFADVAVGWLLKAEITSGTGPGLFSPGQSVTRAQMAVFLWRAAGSPTPTGANGFTDVPGGAYYSAAVTWLVGRKVTSGTSPGKYSPSQPVTRSQMAVFLWRSSCSSTASEGLTITKLGQGRLQAVAEKTGAYLAIEATTTIDSGECMGAVCARVSEKVLFSPGGTATPVVLRSSADTLDEGYAGVAITPDGLTGAIVVDTCTAKCHSMDETSITETIEVIDLVTQRVIATKKFIYPVDRAFEREPRPVEGLRMAGGALVWTITSTPRGMVWWPETDETHTFTVSHLVGNDIDWIQQACSDGATFLLGSMPNYPSSTRRVPLPRVDGAVIDASVPGTFSDKLKFTSDCSHGWEWIGNLIWGGDVVQIEDGSSGRWLDLSDQFPGQELDTVVMSDDVLSGVAAFKNVASGNRWEFWRFLADGSQPPVLLGWAAEDLTDFVGGGTMSFHGGGGYVSNDGTFALGGYLQGGDGTSLVIAGGPPTPPGRCSAASIASERPTISRTSDFVVSQTSALTFTVETPVGEGCRNQVDLKALRIAPTEGGQTSSHDMSADAGFAFEPQPLAGFTRSVSASGGSVAITIPAGTLPPGTYDLLGVRQRANATDPLMSDAVRVKIVRPQLELLDRQARSHMIAAGGKWENVAKTERQFFNFDTSGASVNVVEVFGDLDSATNVAVQISGVGENASDRYSTTGQFARHGTFNSERIWFESAARDRYGTAVIAWHDYQAPGYLDVAFNDLAMTGASQLASDLETLGLASGSTIPTHVSIIGHSYGSLLAGLAVMKDDVSPDDLVLVGSPGVEIDTFDLACGAGDTCEGDTFQQTFWGSEDTRYHYGVSALKHVRPGHVFTAAAEDDDVTSYLAGFGTPPHWQGFGANEFHTDDRLGYRSSYGHSEYFDVGTTSLHNIGSIVRGDYARVFMRDYSPFPL